MATFILTNNQDIFTGGSDNDLFFGNNTTLNAGDILAGGAGTDSFFFSADATLANPAGRTYAAFQLNGVENFDVVNDSVGFLAFDLSSSTGVQNLSVSNSSNAVVFREVTSLASLTISNTTNVGNTNVTLSYRDSVVAGATTVNLTLDDTNANQVTIGSSSAFNSGIETVNLVTTGGDSTIANLDTNLTTLNITGSAADSVTISNALNTTVRTINNNGAGDVTLSWVNNTVGVNYTGSQTGTGINTLVAGIGNDTIITYAGDDVINAGGGNDTINAGEGNNTVRTGSGNNSVTTGGGADIIFAQGAIDTINSGAGNDRITLDVGSGATTVNAGDGSDLVVGTGGRFDASNAGGDVLNMGAGFDALTADAGLNDVNFTNVTGLEALSIATVGTTNLGGGVGPNNRAQLAGLDSLFLISGGNDVVNASTFTSGLSVRSFGNDFNTDGVGDDTITTGSGRDLFLWRGDNNLTDADRLDGGAGFDQLNLEGDTTINGASFRNFEFLALESSRFDQLDPNAATAGGNIYNITLTDANAPSFGVLFVNGSALQGDTDGAGPLISEDAFISTQNVTTYTADITTGNGNDTILSGNAGEFIRTQGGNDTIYAGGGNDTIDSGLGNDHVLLQSGNNTVFDEGGADNIYLGTGNDTVFLGVGNDTVWAFGAGSFLGGVFGVGSLNSLDTLIDGGGRDTLLLGQGNYVDADFTNVSGFEIIDLGLSNNSGGGIFGGWGGFAFDGTLTIGPKAQQGGVDTVVGSDANDTIDAQAYTANLTVDLSRGGNDFALTGSGNDLFIAGLGDQNVNGGAGNDTLRVKGNLLTTADAFAGGTGMDTVELDNSGGTVTAAVNLALFTDVETYKLTNGGDLGPGVDANANTLRFGNAPSNTITTLTTIAVDASALTDIDDSLTVTLDASLLDADFAFNITGSSTFTTVVKENNGVNNNVNFQGGSGTDTMIISGNDLGATIIFNGNGGTDVISQTNSAVALTDDSYVGVSNVEVLTSATFVNAILGATAAASGLTTIIGGANDNVLLSAAYTGNLRVVLNTGNDTVNAAASAAALTFVGTDSSITAADVLSGGTTGNDKFELTATGGSADMTNVTGVETITVIGDNNALAANGTTITINTLISEVNGGTQTVNAGALDGMDAFTLTAGTATANLNVTGGAGNDTITTGSGNDVINSGLGNDVINAGNGNNTVNGGGGNDKITTGTGVDTIDGGAGDDIISSGAGNDIINGGDGNDLIRGQDGNDTINGGAGNDQIRGGLGVDIMDGGAGADIFFYGLRAESSTPSGRDTINNFESGVDKIDARGVAEAIAQYTFGPMTLNFAGNFANFGDAQSSITAGDGILDIVYQQDTNTLWFDLNDDGTLNADDLQITVNTTGLNDTLSAADVYSGSAIGAASLTAFEALFI